MLSTNYISRILPKEMWDRFVDIEHEIIMACAGILGDQDLLRLWTTNRFEAEMKLRQELDRITGKHWNKSARKELKDAFETAAKKALNADEIIFHRAYEANLLAFEAPAISQSQALNGILQSGYAVAEKSLTKANLVALNMALSKINEAVSLVGSGDISIDAAIRAAVNDLAAIGVTGKVYPSGARISLAPYVRREVTTGVMNTTRQLSLERAKEWGADLIQVSVHAGARPGCFPYQGNIYSLSGESTEYPSLERDTSYGEPAGLFGINCRHFSWPWFEGLNDEHNKAEKDPAGSQLNMNNEELYDLTQEQRYNERQIRAWKTRASLQEEAGLNPTKAKAKIKEWQATQRKFLKDNPILTRDYQREAA